MTDLEKMIGLLMQKSDELCDGCRCRPLSEACIAIANHLLANGVLIAPCKIGDDIWWINEDTNTVECCKGDVSGFAFGKDGVLIRDECGYYEKPGTTYCFLTKEDAEAELARRANND